MKEIGGYFELEQLLNNEYYKNLLALNTGRSSLVYLMKVRNIRKVYIPYFLCESIYEILDKYNYKYEFYQITNKFLPDFEKSLLKDEYLYIVNFYGQLDNNQILKLKSRYINIIVDNTHSFFQQPIDGIDTIYNCRKWFGVPDGAYLSTNIFFDEKLELDSSKDRMEHLLGRYEGNASDYYSYFKENDKKFECEPIKAMSKLTRNLMGAIDYNRVIDNRNKNYYILEAAFSEINKLKITKPNVPFCYPLYLDQASFIRKKLIDNKVYIPILWPNVLNDNLEGTLEYDMAENILPLPCDQRYDEKDMKRIIKIIKE